MKESRTTYSYLIEHMQEPSFQKIWDIAFDFVRKLPSDLCDELHESLNRGVDVLDSEPLLQMYIYAFGKMHNAKLQYAFEHLQKNVFKYREIEIVDYGCGQGLATICYHDFLQGHIGGVIMLHNAVGEIVGLVQRENPAMIRQGCLLTADGAQRTISMRSAISSCFAPESGVSRFPCKSHPASLHHTLTRSLCKEQPWACPSYTTCSSSVHNRSSQNETSE